MSNAPFGNGNTFPQVYDALGRYHVRRRDGRLLSRSSTTKIAAGLLVRSAVFFCARVRSRVPSAMTDEFTTAMQLLLGDRPTLDDVQQAAACSKPRQRRGMPKPVSAAPCSTPSACARPPDWDRALDHLALAARQGSRLRPGTTAAAARQPVRPVESRADDGSRGLGKGPGRHSARATHAARRDARLVRHAAHPASSSSSRPPAECRWLIDARAGRGSARRRSFDQSTGDANASTRAATTATSSCVSAR